MTSASGQTSADRRHLAPDKAAVARVRAAGGRAASVVRTLRGASLTTAIKLVIGEGGWPRAASRPRRFAEILFQPSRPSSGHRGPPRRRFSSSHYRSPGLPPAIAAYISLCFVCRRPVDTSQRRFGRQEQRSRAREPGFTIV